MINEVFTAREAALLWGYGANTVTKYCQLGYFLEDEARQSKGTWLVTYAGMKRITKGKEPDYSKLEGK